VKGYLLGVALDLELRGRSDNQVSLDDVMRAMWDQYGAMDIPYEPRQVCVVAETLLGESLDEFWSLYLHGREDFDWERAFGFAGLTLLSGEGGPVLQITPAPGEGLVKIQNVLAGGAAQEAGLMAGDTLVAIEGRRVTPSLLATLGHHFRPGHTVEVSYFRRDRLHTTRVRLGAQKHYAVVPDSQASALAQALRADWLSPSVSRVGTRA
jgi:predicted metalloprotease with PDZ domain